MMNYYKMRNEIPKYLRVALLKNFRGQIKTSNNANK